MMFLQINDLKCIYEDHFYSISFHIVFYEIKMEDYYNFEKINTNLASILIFITYAMSFIHNFKWFLSNIKYLKKIYKPSTSIKCSFIKLLVK